MKFFTMAWWGGLQAGAEGPVDRMQPFRDYGAYLETFVDRLPAGAVALNQTVPLHDARLRALRFTPATAALLIELENFYGDSGERRRFFLSYDEVSAFASLADPDVGLPGPAGYGDLGYDELDISPDGQLIHRLLFSSGIELQITCRDAWARWQEDGASGSAG